MTAEACAGLVRRGDPDRWRTAMAAPPLRRAGLMALYAFNLEIARAPWLASEPMLAEMRLQWWADAITEIADGQAPRRHEVVTPLAETIRAADLPPALFLEAIAARLADAAPGSPADAEALWRYIDHTSGHLMELAARHLGATAPSLPAVRDFARGAGLAALLRAVPELRARGREPLPPRADLAALAREGRAAITAARSARLSVPRALLPALLPGRLADARLAQAESDPACVGQSGLEMSEFRERFSLIVTATTGRW